MRRVVGDVRRMIFENNRRAEMARLMRLQARKAKK
jgi:hypothetical protein